MSRRFLRDSVSQLQEEKQLANDMGKRYKLALENAKKPPRTAGALSSSRADSSSQEHKQQDRQVMSKIATLMGKSSFPCPADVDLSSPHSLRELCLSLLETLGDRMTQLRHQRGANRHIAMRWGAAAAVVAAATAVIASTITIFAGAIS